MEMFSWENIQSLPAEDKAKLKEFLPKELKDNEAESEKTLELLFTNQLTRFDQTTLDTFFNNLQDGNYRPDIARYRKKILEAEKKDQMIKECDYLSSLVENVISSREKLLREAYGMNSRSKTFQTSENISENLEHITPATFRAKDKYLSELSSVFDQLNLPVFDEELLKEKKKQRLNPQIKSEFNDSPIKINGTMSSKQTISKHYKVGKERYKQILKSFKKRKSIEPDHPELEYNNLNLNDISQRVKLTVKPRKIKRESETEDDNNTSKIKIKKEPVEIKKRKYNQVNRKRRIVEAKGPEQKRKMMMDSKVLRIGCDSLENTTAYPSSDASEELNLRNVRYACFFSLIRDIFCSTADHRMKLEEFRQEIKAWNESTTATLNSWFKNVEDWNVLLLSSVQFLSGEFKNLPSDFVPYLEFKTQLNMYQWIGAGRDSDARMSSLYDFWIIHKNDGAIKKSPMKFKVFEKSTKNPEINPDNQLKQACSPPNPRCRSEWKVNYATKDELREFQIQERRRFERQGTMFTYHQHGYFSVVGPIDTSKHVITPIQKMKDNSFLIQDRPSCVSLPILVRDAAARMPNGEGTRNDISKLLKYSQYLLPNLSESVVETIVREILDKVHKEEDCYLKFDSKKNIWIYLHRNRTAKDFETVDKIKKAQGTATSTANTSIKSFETIRNPTVETKTINASNIVKIPAKKVFKIAKMTESGGFDVEESVPGTITKKIQRIIPKKPNQIVNPNQKFEFKVNNQFVNSEKTIVRVSEDQKQNLMKIQDSTSPITTAVKSQQKIILTSSALAANKGKIMTIVKNDSMVPMLSHQKQILTNVIVQQQKAKTPNQVILTNVNQKMPSITISSKNIRPTSVLQLPQTSNEQKITTTNIIQPQQRQITVQTNKPPTTITTNVLSAIKGKPIKTDLTNAIKTNSGIIQISPQFMMSKGKVIQIPNNSQIISSTSDTNVVNSGFSTDPSTSKNQLKIIQSGTIPQQQLVGAKLLNVTGLTGRTVRTTSGVK